VKRGGGGKRTAGRFRRPVPRATGWASDRDVPTGPDPETAAIVEKFRQEEHRCAVRCAVPTREALERRRADEG
jgi:hypothetical protein